MAQPNMTAMAQAAATLTNNIANVEILQMNAGLQQVLQGQQQMQQQMQQIQQQIQQQMQQQTQQMQQQIQQIQQQMQLMQETLQQDQRDMNTSIARVSNSNATNWTQLMPLPMQPGAQAHFPRTRVDLAQLSGPQLSELLEAYAQPVPNAIVARRQAFSAFIGCGNV